MAKTKKDPYPEGEPGNKMGGDKIIVSGGKVKSYSSYTCFNLNPPMRTVHVEREDDGFMVSIQSNKGGGPPNRAKMIEEALDGMLHESFHAGHIELFGMEDPTEDDIRAIKNFERAKIIFAKEEVSA